jgi:hypothetical protein
VRPVGRDVAVALLEGGMPAGMVYEARPAAG